MRRKSKHEISLILRRLHNKKRFEKMAKEMLALPPRVVEEESPIAKLDFKIL